MSKFTIAGRGSWLSLAQIDLFKQQVRQAFPDAEFDILIKKTAGDIEQSTPLHLVEGKDFFTAEIQESLRNGEADFAIHSMKDVSSESFFNHSHYVVFNRNDIRDVALFNPDCIEKIKAGKELVLGTSSPRRSNMSADFLRKALPQLNTIKLNVLPIRGNVDSRLQKLHEGHYDGIILAVAGLNRLLQYEPSADAIKKLLANKKMMLLPLFECPPAAGQGAVVAETNIDNTTAIKVLEAIKNNQLTQAVQQERIYAQKYGYGCSQQFGVFHQETGGVPFTYVSGKDNGSSFTEWDVNVPLVIGNRNVFSASNYMADFFHYRFHQEIAIADETKAVFIASHKAVHPQFVADAIKPKRIFAAGTKTWLSLAQKGLWVEGCADGLGLEFFRNTLSSPLINITQNDVQIITNTESAEQWRQDGWKAAGTYDLIPALSEALISEVKACDIAYWTSFKQFELCRDLLKPGVTHACPVGKTAELFNANGIRPVLFPGIKLFNQWQQSNTRKTAEG